LRKVERLEEARKSFKWWEAAELPDGLNWRKLEHAGISFAPPYVKHGIPMKYDGKILHLTDVQEEMASHYAALPDDGPQLGIPKTRVVFQKNFFEDFKKTFPNGNIMKKFEKCDFTAIKEHLDLQKSLRKAATDEEKAVKKAEKEVVVLQFGYCLIDGRIERVSNHFIPETAEISQVMFCILMTHH
jgi:DNA topoisomerase I